MFKVFDKRSYMKTKGTCFQELVISNVYVNHIKIRCFKRSFLWTISGNNVLTIGILCSFTEREVNTLKLKMYIFWLIKAVLYSYSSFDHFNLHHKRGIRKQHISCNNWFLCYCLRRVYFLTRPSVMISNSVVQCCYRFRFMGKFGPF